MNLPKKTQRQRASEAVNVLDSVFALVLPEKVETLQRIVDVWDESTDTFIVNGLMF